MVDILAFVAVGIVWNFCLICYISVCFWYV
jgi:hypothetical protein